jgi:hypothetical protein
MPMKASDVRMDRVYVTQIFRHKDQGATCATGDVEFHLIDDADGNHKVVVTPTIAGIDAMTLREIDAALLSEALRLVTAIASHDSAALVDLNEKYIDRQADWSDHIDENPSH